jgi:uncharacterized protein (TIGR02145 family)
MKQIINFLKRAHLFRGTLAYLGCLFFLILSSCEKSKPDQAYFNRMDKNPPSESLKKDKPKHGKVTDIEKNIYKTVQIGGQWWMAENLKSTKYNDGSPIPEVTDNSDWINLTTEGYCWYDNDISNKKTFGALYNWFTVRNGNLCPKGWHIPSDMEWITLIDFLGGEGVAGGKLKETGTIHWIYPNSGATNESGFTALASGDRIGADGSFYNLYGYAIYWSSDEASYDLAINRVLVFDDTNFRIGYDNKTAGFSVRCIRNN